MGCASSSDRGASASKTSAFDRQLIDAVRVRFASQSGAVRTRLSLRAVRVRLRSVTARRGHA